MANAAHPSKSGRDQDEMGQYIEKSNQQPGETAQAQQHPINLGIKNYQ